MTVVALFALGEPDCDPRRQTENAGEGGVCAGELFAVPASLGHELLHHILTVTGAKRQVVGKASEPVLEGDGPVVLG